jgi:hypothetical protein
MMRQGLVGLDVLTVAVHLTAAMLAGSYPDTPFDGECLLTMPYGTHSWGVCVGSWTCWRRKRPSTSFRPLPTLPAAEGRRKSAI